MNQICFSILTLVFSTTVVATELPETVPTFEGCQFIRKMAILNDHDQQLYWTAEDSEQNEVESCYQDLQEFSKHATPKMIHDFESAYASEIRIFDVSADFESFIKQNGGTTNEVVLLLVTISLKPEILSQPIR